MVASTALALFVGISAQAERRRNVSSHHSTQPRVFSLAPAVHYDRDFNRNEQWERYKRQHDENVRREAETARWLNLSSYRQAQSVYSRGGYVEPYVPPKPTGPPGRAEVTEFAGTFEQLVAAFVKANTHGKRGFLVKDDRTGETLGLRLQHVHADRLRYHSAAEVSGCADFVTADAPKREVDLDFEVAKDFEWKVSKVFVHGVNGRQRFVYNANNVRAMAADQAPSSRPAGRPKAPAHLSASIEFSGAAEGLGALSVTVSNAGPGDAYEARLTLDPRSLPPGVSLPRETSFGDLAPGKSATREIPISAPRDSKGGRIQVTAAVIEANGFDTEPMLIEFDAAPPVLPALELHAASVEGGAVKPGETARLSVKIRNAGKASALGARAALRLEGKNLFMSGEPSVELGDLAPGESKSAVFEFFVNRRVAAGEALPVFLAASDSAGRNGFSELPLPLKIGQTSGPLRVVSIAGRAEEEEFPSVDLPPPARTPQDPRSFAVVIGIEKYRDVAGVDYAGRDAQSVADYLTGSMGFRRDNVVLLKDERAGRADLYTYLGPWLADRATEKNSRVFIYYSGHGTVDPKTGETYLVPYDGDPAYSETKGYALKDLYASLGRLPNAEAVVALDSCFSGTGGRSVLPKGLRPLVPVKAAAVPGNVVVLSAGGNDQVSATHPKARHGLMTYYLLNGLRGAADADRDGRITTLEVYGYLRPEVEAEARRQHIEQRPRLDPSPDAIGPKGAQVWVVR